MKGIKDKIELYIVSLFLLFFLIIILTINIPICFEENCKFIGLEIIFKNNIVPLTSFIMLIWGLIGIYRFKYKVSGSVKTRIKIERVSNKNYEHLTFLTTYIIPLVAFDLTNIRYFFVLLILLLVIGIIYIKTNLFFSNPSLAILGYKIYKVNAKFRLSHKENIIIISKDKISIGDEVSYKKIDENIYFGRKNNNG